MTNKWIQKALKGHHKGALHRQLGVPTDENIPLHMLTEIKERPIGSEIRNYKTTKAIKITRLLKKRALLALNLRH
jgi:hypothetical protein